MTAPLHQAMDLQRQGLLAEAESIYLQFLRAEPRHVDALHEFGVLRMRQGRPDEAIELVKRSLSLAPRNAVAWNSLANMLLGKDPKAAELAYRNATSLKPDYTEAWYNLGNFLRDQQRPQEALGCYRRVLELKPRFRGAYENIARFATGRSEIAAEAYRAWLEAEPDNAVARHMAAAHSGQAAPPRADDAYVIDIFNRGAESFDTVLAKLEYAAPELVIGALQGALSAAERSLAVLDAGCGTGLCGPLLRSSARRLVGVDLSAGMLAKARERQVYDELHEAELVAFMRANPLSYDAVVSADTLVYFGVLEDAIDAAAAALRPGGLLTFTVEAEPAESTRRFRLHESGRYSHGVNYVRECISAARLELLQFEPGVLRKEGGADVAGHVVLARKVAAANAA
jgi:predicted TPR repeat methyltransferase